MARPFIRTIIPAVLVLAGSVAVQAQTIPGLRAHLNFLADDLLEGREAGTEGYLLAARYVESQYRQIGLEPAGTDGYLQPIEFRRYQLVPDSGSIVIGDRELERGKDFLILASPTHTTMDVTAPVVFAGYGINAPQFGRNDWEDLDVEGKIVAYLTGAPADFPTSARAHFSSSTGKMNEAASRGAVGVILLRSRTDAKRTPWERLLGYNGRPGMRWLYPDGTVNDGFPGIAASAYISDDAAVALFEGSAMSWEQVLDAADANEAKPQPLKTTVTIRARTEHERVTSPNVIAMLPGSDPELRDEYVIYTAHLDHVGVNERMEGDQIHNGAYDNAMGSSILIETARAMAANPPARSVLFAAVTAEEKGLLGAEYLAKNPTIGDGRIIANINLDMPLFLFPTGDIIAYGAEHSSLGAVAERVAKAEGLTLSPDPRPEQVIFVRSDHYRFVQAGIPALYLIPGQTSKDPTIDGAARVEDFGKKHYHRPSDQLDLPVDWESALQFTRINLQIGNEIANAAERPRWNEGDFFGDLYGPELPAAGAE